MGLDRNGASLLLYAKNKVGVDFGQTLMLGRQWILFSKRDLETMFKSFKVESSDDYVISEKYAEGFFKFLGSSTIDSIDASDYEGSSFIHDLNLPVPSNLTNRFDTVFDGGTLEHVFNFPVAVQNCMKMLKLDGHFIGITPTNNFSGHGFYQFSPELYFRVFSPENGFEVRKMIFFIDKPDSRMFELQDPLTKLRRVKFSNLHPSYLFVVARKIAERKTFATFPLQSDYYNVNWTSDAKSIYTQQKVTLKRKLIELIPHILLSQWRNFRKITREYGDGYENDFREVDIFN